MARYIDADKLIETLKEIQQSHSPNLTKTTNAAIDLGLSLAMRMVRKEPTADVEEVKHGEWIINDYTGHYICSICESYQPYETRGEYRDYWDCDYCPICGARMDGERRDV